MRPRSVSIGVLVAVLVVSTEGRADNTEPFFYSDDAAMTGGTAVATTRDAGAIWYNPAGLGGIRRGQIDLSASAFGVRIRTVPDALRTSLPNSQQSVTLGSVDIFSAPHALGIVRNINESLALGFGFYVTARDIRTAQSQGETTGPSIDDPTVTARYRQRLDLSIDQTRYHFGPSIGWEVTDGVRLGASLFGTYGKQNGFAQFLIASQGNGAAGPSTLFSIGQQRYAFSYFGVQPEVGVQWAPSPEWMIGALVRAPELLLNTSVESANIDATGFVSPTGKPAASFTLETPNPSFPAFTIVAPLRAVVGAAYMIAPRTWVSGELDVQAGFSNQGIEQASVINGRAGGRYAISDKLGIGLGLFTDRATQPRLGNSFTDERVDNYGATVGFELRTPLSLSEHPTPDALVLSTTIALKYAIGFGKVRAADVDLVTFGNPPPREVDVIYHTILPYIGSGILF